MKKVALASNEEIYIVEEEKVYKCITDETIDSIWVKREYFEKLDFSEISTSEKEEVIDFLENNDLTDGTDFLDTYSQDTLVEPNRDEWVVVHSSDSPFGEDPYMWDYANYGFTYWDGSNHVEVTGGYISNIKLLKEKEVRDETINYGRAITYRIYKDEDGDIFISYENDGYSTPEKCVDTKVENFYDSSSSVSIYETIEDSHDETFVFVELPNDYYADFVTDRKEAMRIVSKEVA
jgi:hypothetical protein